MPRVQPKLLSLEERKELLKTLWRMIALLETEEEVERFFRDLLSETEAIMLARRVRIAYCLLRRMSYETIKEAMHTSDVTIANVHRWLQSGFGGYAGALPLLQKELERQSRKRGKERARKTPYTFEWLKRRYPLHFLLFNLFDWADEKLQKPKKLSK